MLNIPSRLATCKIIADLKDMKDHPVIITLEYLLRKCRGKGRLTPNFKTVNILEKVTVRGMK